MEAPGRMFDTAEAARQYNIPAELLDKFIKQARGEFGSDDMMVELHVIRAIRAYAEKTKKAAQS